ncbi:MAG: ribbon-helix-helix domain-containing protein [Candidatus Aenigmarchaeota archaeon]|nr:ribbon-helix-helix domain-containing protein [Candidatus Aenigmarchaeota archaeon]
MIPVQIRINRKMIEKIDQLVEDGVYSNRSEVIRDATRRLVIEFSGKNGMKTEGLFQESRINEVKRNG